jgi:hypothetical protein
VNEQKPEEFDNAHAIHRILDGGTFGADFEEETYPMSFDPVIGVYALAFIVVAAIYTVLHKRAEARSRATKAEAAEAGLLEPASLHPKIARLPFSRASALRWKRNMAQPSSAKRCLAR